MVILGATTSPSRADDPSTTFSGELRFRVEALDGAFHRNRRGSDQLATSRGLLQIRHRRGAARLEAEFADSRAWLDDSGTPLGTDDVNVLEPLQFFVAWTPSARVALRAGRMTRDLGSRRHLGRQRFRNTFNTFTGIDGSWRTDTWAITAFWYHPVRRHPADRADLADHARHFDRSHSGFRFVGAHAARKSGRRQVEWTLLNLLDDDDAFANRDRNLTTFGLRLRREPAPGTWDYDLDVALQAGSTRGGIAPTSRRLDHFAGFIHAEAGYHFGGPWQTRLVGQFNVAGGDRDPADGDSDRYDGNFGVRVFDYGPTGIYGAFSRSNTAFLRLRLFARPSTDTRLQVALAHYRLSSARDRHATSALNDPTGHSGRDLGIQLEFRAQYRFMPRLSGAVGGAFLSPGDYLEDAPARTHSPGNTRYVYAEATLRF